MKHPTIGVRHLRRQILETHGPASGGKALWKASLGTKVVVEAAILFIQANAALHSRFNEARERPGIGASVYRQTYLARSYR